MTSFLFKLSSTTCSKLYPVDFNGFHTAVVQYTSQFTNQHQNTG